MNSPLRSLSVAPSRRGALRLLAAAILGHFGVPRIAAAHDALPACKKKKDKKKRKKCLKKAKQHNAEHTIPQVFEFTGGPQFYTAPPMGS